MKKENKILAQKKREQQRKKNTCKKFLTDFIKNKLVYVLVVIIIAVCAADAFMPEYRGVIYLTFDDGPGEYTEQLLDILDKYDVKATFFVTNQYPEYQHLIGEAHDRGHAIALHSYSHDYEDIYSSKKAYYDDLLKMEEICIRQTGVKPKIVRFPGGTDNTVSKKYCQGIMTDLTKTLWRYGYVYTDWNVNAGDAETATTSEMVAENVIKGIKKNETSIVLQHDTKEYSVEAVEEIIKWGLQYEYKFSTLKGWGGKYKNTPAN